MKLEIIAQMETGRDLTEDELDALVDEIQTFLDDDASLFNVYVELADVQDGSEDDPDVDFGEDEHREI